MRWAPIHPRQLMAVALLATALSLLTMFAGAADLGSLDFSLSSGAPAVTEPAPAGAPSAEQPAWVTDPVASPLSELASPPRAS